MSIAPEVGTPPREGWRPEIQALRAVAVALVVVYHLWPAALPGGFVGVDVFFVISGFLITAHLAREVGRTGRLSLSGFWARRARRILPAALLVLAVCAAATLAVAPEVRWDQYFAEIRASTAYVENWHLAGAAVDYLASDDPPSPVRHFWSLSAEEQFYLVWPLLVLLGVLIPRRWGTLAVLLAVSVASLAYGLWAISRNPAAAFFVTPVRAWEFGAGGVLAVLPVAAVAAGVRGAVSWFGLALVASAAVAFSDATPFPGAAALVPVLGAAAVIWAGAPSVRWAPTPVLRLRPIQFVGDVSYSIYLWHWPLLVFIPFVTGEPLGRVGSLVVVALTVLLAWLTKLLVEDPVRRGVLASRRARATFVTLAAATAAVLLGTVVGDQRLEQEIRGAEQELARVLAGHPSCFGAAARDSRHPCRNPHLAELAVPRPVAAVRMPNAPCRPVERRDVLRVCDFGYAGRGAVDTAALVGDSHASHWRAALQPAFETRRWRGLSLTRTNCPLTTAPRARAEPLRSRCARWSEMVLAWLARHPEVHIVFLGQSAGTQVDASPAQGQFAARVEGYAAAWSRLPPSVERVVVLRDTPRSLKNDATLACVELALGHGERPDLACALPRRRAMLRDPAVKAARLASRPIEVADLTRYFCDRRRCYPVVGGVLVYNDSSHLTQAFARTLAPYLLRELHSKRRSADPGAGSRETADEPAHGNRSAPSATREHERH